MKIKVAELKEEIRTEREADYWMALIQLKDSKTKLVG